MNNHKNATAHFNFITLEKIDNNHLVLISVLNKRPLYVVKIKVILRPGDTSVFLMFALEVAHVR